mmetsp:Transcript_14276/g.32447  ORF Transcript_14276/g.32447 Transcript_14276/m.32447 type:complete len:565 (-) Transcript_14276:97-1791(-)
MPTLSVEQMKISVAEKMKLSVQQRARKGLPAQGKPTTKQLNRQQRAPPGEVQATALEEPAVQATSSAFSPPTSQTRPRFSAVDAQPTDFPKDDSREIAAVGSHHPVWHGGQRLSGVSSSSELHGRRRAQEHAEVGFGSVADRAVDPMKWNGRVRPGCMAGKGTQELEIKGYVPDLSYTRGDGVFTGRDLKGSTHSEKLKREDSHRMLLALNPDATDDTVSLSPHRRRCLHSPVVQFMREQEGCEVAHAIVSTAKVHDEAQQVKLGSTADTDWAGQPTIKVNERALPSFQRNERMTKIDEQLQQQLRSPTAKPATRCRTARLPPGTMPEEDHLVEDEVRRTLQARRLKPRSASAEPAAGARALTETWQLSSWDWAAATATESPKREETPSHRKHFAARIQPGTCPGESPPKCLRSGPRIGRPAPLSDEPEKLNLHTYPEVFRFSRFPSPKRKGPPEPVEVQAADESGRDHGISSTSQRRPGFLRSLSAQPRREQQSSLAMMQALAEPTAQQNEQERAARMASEPHFAALVQATQGMHITTTCSLEIARSQQASYALIQCLQAEVA